MVEVATPGGDSPVKDVPHCTVQQARAFRRRPYCRPSRLKLKKFVQVLHFIPYSN